MNSPTHSYSATRTKMLSALAKKTMSFGRIALLIVMIMLNILYPLVNKTSALPECDYKSINGTWVNFVSNDCDTVASCGSDGSAISGATDVPPEVLDAINKLKDVYVKAGQASNVPWQVLAAIHYREGGNSPNSDLQAGNPIGTGGSQFSSLGAQSDIQTSATNAGLELQDKAKAGVFKKPIDAANPDGELIKDALFGYNGRNPKYAEVAASLGFDPAKQPYEGSPYVMNQFDAKHQNMKIVTHDFGPVDGVDTRMGAFTLYSRLGGASGGGAGCSGSGGGGSIVGIAQQQIGLKEDPIGCNCGSQIQKFLGSSPGEFWCADFVSWVYKEAGHPFTGGQDGGWRISYVPTMQAWFQQNGIWHERGSGDIPQPGDAVIFGGSGHVGIVEKVEGDTLTTIEGNTSDMVLRRTYPNYLSNSDIVGWGRMK